ncbi:hypothetical protein A3D77_04110 [Candidatus Gottesmanbacteria bacterium RIFCSPHIGHO2_02_FULL_39_11]|uniref:MBL fold metallo-hydrolase n=1 Tax=Candidatus Gottesmanbacteria bacterium RIFCSPHIGHO2_02_FULL_39_11 TaxID=1798382 RepID=A0A1F5ZJZ4_9BACT|nr:MAG: hypothetical protein A3D77_04110 [Candidatus Gottesmanbacteria bacterium RIFCSPHIGHO2_02_FULL_39_11]
MKIKFLGAAGTVTGSCYQLTSESEESILIDCGLFQGPDYIEKYNYAPFESDASSLTGIILTHAHLDHCGRLPILLNKGFKEAVWMTRPTCDLAEISLFDSAKINNKDSGKRALYTKDDVSRLLEHVKTVEYNTVFSAGCFSITFYDAGHILGSASIEIIDESSRGKTRKIIFSGDLGNTPQDLIRPTQLIASGDVVVMESTYGDRAHPEENPSEIIRSEINTVEKSGGVLLIPAFSIERSQEVLHRIFHLRKEGKINGSTRIYFDSPMAQKATEVFEKYKEYYNPELTSDFKENNPFHFPELITSQNRGDSGNISLFTGPKIIIAGSGMMNGGRILSHALNYLPLSSTRLLFVGYQSDGTLGREILRGQKSIDIEGNSIYIHASISQTQAMSSHADYPKLLSWLRNITGARKVFLTHGEENSRASLSGKIKKDLKISGVVLPTLNQEVWI